MSDEDSTHEIELEALRARNARGQPPSHAEEDPTLSPQPPSRRAAASSVTNMDAVRPGARPTDIDEAEARGQVPEALEPEGYESGSHAGAMPSSPILLDPMDDDVELADIADVIDDNSSGSIPIAVSVELSSSSLAAARPMADSVEVEGLDELMRPTPGAIPTAPARVDEAAHGGPTDESADDGAHGTEDETKSEPDEVPAPSRRPPPSARTGTGTGPSPQRPPDRDYEPAPSILGRTLPGHDVAQALRAMMGEVPDDIGAPVPTRRLDDDTQTRLPLAVQQFFAGGPPPDQTNEQEALPAFSLFDEDDERAPDARREPPAMAPREEPPTQTAAADPPPTEDDDPSFGDRGIWPPPTPRTRARMQTPATVVGTVNLHELTSETTAVVPGALLKARAALSETTAVFRGPVPSMALPSSGRQGESISEVPTDESVPMAMSTTPSLGADTSSVSLDDSDPDPHLGGHILSSEPSSDEMAEPDGALPRFTLASIPEMPETAAIFEPFPRTEYETPVAMPAAHTSSEGAPVTILSTEPPPPLLLAGEMADDALEPAPPASTSPPPSSAANARSPSSSSLRSIEIQLSASSVDITSFEDSEAVPSAPESIEAEVVELLPEEILQPTSVAPKAQRVPTFRPPPNAASERPPAYLDNPDDEASELIAEGRFGPLIAVYRQRLGFTDGPNKQAALLLKIASVYEHGLEDSNEAFETLMDAFETAPSNEDVITAVDRLGKATQRIGELADRVKKKLLPGAPDDKRVVYLAHLVYWYERVLGRGNEVSSFVSEIERHDRVHPVVLKRAAQIAAMNDDVKTQREHLLRALERTSRREEKVLLHIALASAFTGTPEVTKYYEAALELDPTCLVALQGLKRLGKEKENYAQVVWALEQQAKVAPTNAERIDALLELAEIQETKFLQREAAADLLERVLVLEPAHPAALKALERCYHALRNWEALSRVLSARSEHTFDARAKVDLLERAAEVHESKLGDPAGAVEIYRNILVVEPKHRRSLGDLARLYEKLGDWGNVATYKARLAELAMSKRTSSQELVKLGDLLNLPERDPIAARLQYERAVVVDPTNAAGWEALQKLAAASGDERRVIECLEQRKNHTDVPRQRAVVLVELANVHLARGDDEAARKCFEAAIRADSSNEPAAVAMLDAYTAEERWGDAAPLCELLVNAAIRDRDGEALFVRLRLATRIAAALGDADRAVTSAIAALEARPKDSGAQADLIAVCSQSPSAAARAREHILPLAEVAEELSGEMAVRLAHLLRDAGDLDAAVTTYLHAWELLPEAKEIPAALAEIYLTQGDYPRTCKLKVDLARNATSAEERFELFVEAGEIWARRADELEKAASVFEEARAIKPMDPWLLQTLTWLYGELGDFATLSTVLEDLAQVQEKPAEKVKTLLTLSDVFRDRLGDLVRAADLHDQVLDIDKKRLDVFEELVRALTEAKNWDRLERSYRKMIARVKDDGDPQLQFALFQQLGLIYRDRLGDASRAYDALDAASRIQPDNPEVRKIVIELLIVTDNLDNAVTRLRSALDRNPHDPELYAELYDVFLRQHAFDKAWCVVNVLARLRDPTIDQRRFHEDYAPMPLDRVPGQIVEQAWRSHVFHADLDPALTSLFALMTPAVARMRFSQLRPEQRVGRPFTPTHSRMHDTIRAAFNNAAEILSVAPPELLLAEPKSPVPFSPALAPFGSIMVCVPQVEPQAGALTYLVGKRLAEQRPELTARAFFPAVADLSSLLGTAMRVSRNEVAMDAASAALDASFAAILTPQERDGIRSIVLQATSEGVTLDVKRWSHAADLSSMRAGLLLAGDVGPVRDTIIAEPQNPSDLPQEARIAELLRFAISDLYSDLRGAIGVAVQA
jgi:tetratricopeptide (TPR) repeat protein